MSDIGWDRSVPSLRERATAFLNALTSGRFEHRLKSTIGVRPTTPPMGNREMVQLDVYKVWFVLHYDETGDERTTNLYVRKIDETFTERSDIHQRSIKASCLPIDHDEWYDEHGDTE